jgi:hypothetical protein
MLLLNLLKLFFNCNNFFGGGGGTEKTQVLLDEVFQEHEAIKGAGVVSLPIDLEAGNLVLKVIPWIGGRIISIRHNTNEWLEGRFESGCYEEYSGSEWRSSGCTEEYKVIRYSIKSHL